MKMQPHTQDRYNCFMENKNDGMYWTVFDNRHYRIVARFLEGQDAKSYCDSKNEEQESQGAIVSSRS